ncbi:MAG: hypothetical protein L0154_14155 [Chloroflexi bacterium]|nr:hypothetical protein [Chloroflexota bacterium]
MTHVEQTLTRILSHEWTQQPLKLSHVRLFEEFLYRYMLWIEGTGNRAEYSGFSLPSLFVEDINDIEEAYSIARKHLAKTGMSIHLSSFVLMSLHWAYLTENRLTPDLELPDPYEPVLLFYERGGLVKRSTVVKDFIITDGTQKRYIRRNIGYRREYTPLLSLEKDYLDKLDEESLPEQD